MSYLDRIAACNNADLGRYRSFFVAGQRVGWVGEAIAERLRDFPELFTVLVDSATLNPDIDGFEARSEAVDGVLRTLHADGVIPGWRDEPYPVATSFAAAPLMRMERAAVPLFGVRAYGVHMNGFVRDGEAIRMWIGHRALDKPTFPGMLDNMVAGGQPLGISLMDNLIKEAAEEAAIPEDLARRAWPVGAISYCAELADGLKPDVQFCYDLELPADFTPRNTDGEIASFELMPIDEVLRIVAETTEFKFNCNLVIIDFAVRHGLIPPEHPDYLEILRGLRQ
jgi:isopentenyldiphosphate isomerase